VVVVVVPRRRAYADRRRRRVGEFGVRHFVRISNDNIKRRTLFF
jgi:hypothetical protein